MHTSLSYKLSGEAVLPLNLQNSILEAEAGSEINKCLKDLEGLVLWAIGMCCTDEVWSSTTMHVTHRCCLVLTCASSSLFFPVLFRPSRKPQSRVSTTVQPACPQEQVRQDVLLLWWKSQRLLRWRVLTCSSVADLLSAMCSPDSRRDAGKPDLTLFLFRSSISFRKTRRESCAGGEVLEERLSRMLDVLRMWRVLDWFWWFDFWSSDMLDTNCLSCSILSRSS